MRFIVSSSALFNRLQTIGRVINSKNTLPILDCFLFEIQDNILTITASDSETTLITNLELVESDANARFCINAKTIQDSMKEIAEQPLSFDINPDNMEITANYQNGRFNIVGQSADEYPEMNLPQEDMNALIIPAETMLNGINRCLFATASGDERGIFRHPSRQPYFCLYRRAQIGTQQKLRYQRPSARSLYPSQEAGYDSEKPLTEGIGRRHVEVQ